jgi:hypothetical protein
MGCVADFIRRGEEDWGAWAWARVESVRSGSVRFGSIEDVVAASVVGLDMGDRIDVSMPLTLPLHFNAPMHSHKGSSSSSSAHRHPPWKRKSLAPPCAGWGYQVIADLDMLAGWVN